MGKKGGVSAILDGISRRLEEAFPGVKLYGDQAVEQGLTPPAFFLRVLSPSRIPELGGRYRALNPFDIQYFPAAPGSNAELLEVAEQLMDILETVELEGDLVRGTGRSYRLEEGILHFFVSYNLCGRRETVRDPGMESAAVNTGVKEDRDGKEDG